MMSGPEMARLISEFQASMERPEKKSNHKHHEQTQSIQVEFFNQVKTLSNVIEEMGNSFIDESNDLDWISTTHLSLNVLLPKQHLSMTQLNETNSLSLAFHQYKRNQEQSTSCPV